MKDDFVSIIFTLCVTIFLIFIVFSGVLYNLAVYKIEKEHKVLESNK